jgi:hypothetical protein
MSNFSNMNIETVLKEIRCEKDLQHRIEAAKLLLDQSNHPDRTAYLVNCVLYDPEPEVRTQVKALLFEVYGNELDNILKVEGMDGTPIEDPWIIPCSQVKKSQMKPTSMPKYEDIESFVANKDVDSLHDALRDPLDVQHRICAVRALVKCNNEGSAEMLARAVLHDPDENVQQQAYQALYELIGDEKAEALLEKIGALIMDEDEQWLLIPDYFDEYQHSLENEDKDASLFGINKADQTRGLINLFSGERNPQKRIVIIDTLAQSNDFNVNNAIARVGLFDGDKQVRDHAKSVLENRLGENLDEFLEHVYATASPFVADPDDESEEDEIEESVKAKINNDFSSQINSQEPVVSEGNALNPMIIVAGLIILAMVLYFILR